LLEYSMNLNAKVHPAIAIVVLVLAAFAIVVKAWADGRVLELGGPAQLLRAPSGDVYIQIQNQLLQHGPQGEFKRRINLTELGVHRLIGGISFFPDGDILVRRGDDPRGFYGKLRAFARLENKHSIFSSKPGAGLARCDLDSMQCSVFGDPAIDFGATFHAFIDPEDSAIYFSDTSRHALRRYSADGREVSTVASGMRFPNQLLVQDSALFVADTNNHRIARFDLSSRQLPKESTSIDVVPGEAAARGERWPTHLVQIDGRWWVNNMRRDMRNGGIYLFDENWRFIKRLELPGGADPIAILPFGSGALITDWNNDRVYRLDAAGRLTGDFTSTGLDELLRESRERRNFYKVVSWLGIALFALVLAGLLVKGLSQRAAGGRPQSSPQESGTIEPPADWVWFRPDAALVGKVRRSARVALAAMAVLMAMFVVLAVAREQWFILAGLALPLAGLAAISWLMYWMVGAVLRTEIGLKGDQIALRNHRGRESRSALRHVVFSSSAIATRSQAVLLGQPHKSIYDRQQLDEQLLPHLAKATKISEWQMQLALIRLRHPSAVLLLAVLFAAIVLGGFYLLASCR
jgi:hypothetical protein